jgi:hypothetical protein
MGTVAWIYSDWRSQSTVALQVERLKLHMQEVSGYVLESTRKSSTLRLDAQYTSMLNDELLRLERKLSFSAMPGRFGISSFVRGGGA